MVQPSPGIKIRICYCKASSRTYQQKADLQPTLYITGFKTGSPSVSASNLHTNVNYTIEGASSRKICLVSRPLYREILRMVECIPPRWAAVARLAFAVGLAKLLVGLESQR